MNKQAYESITREYGFLEDYEKEVARSRQGKNPNINKVPNSNNPNGQPNENKYLNNYSEPEPEISQDDQRKSEVDDIRDKYNKTRYGTFVNRDIDSSRLEDPDYLYDNLEIQKRAESQTEMNESSDREAFTDAMNTIKKFEYKFYAFMNKEFNILNKKMIRCSMICYDDPKLFTSNEAKLCAEKCHQNIKEAAKFAENLQEKNKTKLLTCIESAKEFNSESLGEDKVVTFFKCYDTLIDDFNQMEREIKREYSYYI
jgi:hypothetical protein